MERLESALVAHTSVVVHIRSEDGRGPLWWAYEYDRTEIIAALREAGVHEDAKDDRGLKASDMRR